MSHSKNSYWIKHSLPLNMFNLEEFKNNLILEKVVKLNKYLNKNKIDKISKILDQFLSLLDHQEFIIPITYILSILAENKIEFISEQLIKKMESFHHSNNNKLKINSQIVIGFAMLADPNYLDKYSQEFVESLLDEFEDIRNNIHYFLPKLIEKKPVLVKKYLEIILKSLNLENNNNNIISLLGLFEKYKNFEFDHLYLIRDELESLLSKIKDKNATKTFKILITI
ncbi:MAG: hypothetical protein ACFFDF_16985, partial [Candidatus Odinarchaeota archaeon]